MPVAKFGYMPDATGELVLDAGDAVLEDLQSSLPVYPFYTFFTEQTCTGPSIFVTKEAATGEALLLDPLDGFSFESIAPLTLEDPLDALTIDGGAVPAGVLQLADPIDEMISYPGGEALLEEPLDTLTLTGLSEGIGAVLLEALGDDFTAEALAGIAGTLDMADALDGLQLSGSGTAMASVVLEDALDNVALLGVPGTAAVLSLLESIDQFSLSGFQELITPMVEWEDPVDTIAIVAARERGRIIQYDRTRS